ncbi:hypothetical protein RRG08_035355 [Elysia crispata]|uniref:Uncharacterized protein n=1 Tax=Elysia crispata TaxID=231223 RepID=A0AAE0Y3I2_9GAST|nr:hypothetical protein RRG08_035355 [Elysia crispata]
MHSLRLFLHLKPYRSPWSPGEGISAGVIWDRLLVGRPSLGAGSQNKELSIYCHCRGYFFQSRDRME